MKTCITVLLLLCAFTLLAAKPNHDSLARLAKVERFAFGRVGEAGVISQGEKDYRAILSGPSPLANFLKLFTTGNMQAKCYALVGIHVLDIKRFRELSLPLLSDETEVTTMHGCIISNVGIGTVVRRIAEGRYK